MKIVFQILFALGLLWLLGSLGVFFAVFYYANNRDETHRLLAGAEYEPYYPQMRALIDGALAIPCEEVWVRSYDGKKLFGRLYISAPEAPVFILFNGYKGNGIRDFCGGLQLVLERGGNALVVDQRSHGRSEGHLISFGIRERRDVSVWVEAARRRFGEDRAVWLMGVSMGAATVLMAADLPMADNVRGIWADCPYAVPEDVIVTKAASLGIPGARWMRPLLRTAARVYGGFRLRESSAKSAAASDGVPMAIIHGTGDHYVPVEMGRAIRDANPARVRMTEVEGAPHALSLLVDPEGYRRAFDEFIRDTEEKR